MAGVTASSFASSLSDRLTDPRVVLAQVALVGLPVVAVRGLELVAPTNPVLALAVAPVCALLALFFAVDLLQRLTLRIEERAHEETDLNPCWRAITDRTLVVVNAAVVVPLVIWGQPVVGTLGYTTEALTTVLPIATVSGDHTVVSTLLVGGVVVGAALTTRGALAWIQVQFGPDLSTDRLEMYLALRASLPASGSQSIAPLQGGGHGQIGTTALADACVEYRLTQMVPEDLSAPLDIQRIVGETEPVSASTPAKFVFLTTLNTRFLVALFGGLAFIYGGAFGLHLPSIHGYTLWLATGLGVASQLIYNHPFISPSRDVLRM